FITNYFTDDQFCLNLIGSPFKTYDSLWNPNDLIKAMKAIVEAEDQGFILERDLIKEISYKKVYSLVKHNYLYRRSTNQFFNDIINPPDEIILTAMNQPSLCAMKRLLTTV